jgi:thiamine phosphate synthase YjbQ (UPF0047 family)
MTVLSERELGLVTHVPQHETSSVAVAEKDEGFEPDAPVIEAPVEETPKPKRGRKAKSEETS